MKKKLVCKRVLLAVLAICMVLAGLASCKKKEDAGEYAGKVVIDCSKIWIMRQICRQRKRIMFQKTA